MATKNKKTKKSLPSARPPRQRKEFTYRHFKLARKIKPTGKPLPGALKLLRTSVGTLSDHKRLFGGIIAVNTVLSLIFVAGLSSSFDFVQTKQELQDLFGSDASSLGATLTLFGYLVGAAGSSGGESAALYQLLLTLITSLAIIWAVREVRAGHSVSAKDAYYRGLYPLVPMLLVLFVIGLQLLPALIGATLYSIVISGGLAVTGLEQIVWLILFLMLVLLSLYMIFSSVFALYIVTLPEMMPLKALRSARGLVLHRRFNIGLRVIALPLILLIGGLVLIMPVIFFIPWLAMGLFLIYSSFCLVLAHTYMYSLYRELL